MQIDRFDSPLKLIKWTDRNIRQFSHNVGELFKKYPTTFTQCVHETSKRIVIYPNDVAINPDDFDELQEAAYRIVGDLRNALDQGCYAASMIFGCSNEKKVAFPMAEDDVELTNSLKSTKSQYAGIPVELHDVLIGLRPYWKARDGTEGNKKLRTLGEIANPNKHRVALEVVYDARKMSINAVRDVELEVNPEDRISAADRPEVHLTVVGPQPHFQFEFIREIQTSEAGLYSHKSAADAFAEMFAVTNEAIEALRDKCRSAS